MARLPKSTGEKGSSNVNPPRDIPASGSFASGVLRGRDSMEQNDESMPAVGSIRSRIAVFERQSHSANADEADIDRTTTVDSAELDRDTTVDTADHADDDNENMGQLSTTEKDVINPTETAGALKNHPTDSSFPSVKTPLLFKSRQEATSSLPNTIPKQGKSTAELDETEKLRQDSVSVDSTPTPGGLTFDKMRAPTPDAFDVAMGKSEGYKSVPNDKDQGGRLWDAAKDEPPKVPKVLIPREEWTVEVNQTPSVAGSCDLTESTISGVNAFERAMGGCSGDDRQSCPKPNGGGPLGEDARRKSAVPAVAKVRAAPNRDTAADTETHASLATENSVFEKMRAPTPESPCAPDALAATKPDGGRLWEDARRKSAVPAVVKTAKIPHDEQSCQSETITYDTVGGPTFEKLRAPTPGSRQSLAEAQQRDQQRGGGHTWHSAAENRKPTLLPVLARPKEEWIIETADAPSVANESCDLTESTAANEGGGRMWDKAASMSQRPPLPARPKTCTAGTERYRDTQKEASADSSLSTAGGQTFEKVRSQTDKCTPTQNEIDGGRLWSKATDSSKAKPIPAVASRHAASEFGKMQSPSVAGNSCDLPGSTSQNTFGTAFATAQPRSKSALVEHPQSVGATTSTVGGSAFERIRCETPDCEQPDKLRCVTPDSEHPHEISGGGIWDPAGDRSQPKPGPLLAQKAYMPIHTPFSLDDMTESTGPDALNNAVYKSMDFEQAGKNAEVEKGDRLWEKAATTYLKPILPAVSDSPPRSSFAINTPLPDSVVHGFDDGSISTLGGTISEKVIAETSKTHLDGSPLLEQQVAKSSTERPVVPSEAHGRFSKEKQPNRDEGSGMYYERATRSAFGSVAVSENRRSAGANQGQESNDEAPEGGFQLKDAGLAAPVASIVRAIKVHESGRTNILSCVPCDQSHSCSEKTDPTEGASTFEKLRSPTPDAFDIALAKSEDQETVEKFEDEDGGPTWDAARAIKQQTQSRANPNARLADSPRKMVNPIQEEGLEDEFYPTKSQNPGKALRRRQLIQILVIASFVTAFGLLGNFFVSYSCYFVGSSVELGEYNVRFETRYGLWKYSPPESALTGFPYCDLYEGLQADNAPIAARVFHLLSMAAGAFGLGVMWYFLIFGVASPSFWNLAVWMSALAAIFQLLTFVFFTSGTCQENGCEWGLGSSVALVTAFSWVILALELRYQAPYLVDATTGKTNQKKTKNRIEMSNMRTEKTKSAAPSKYNPPIDIV